MKIFLESTIWIAGGPQLTLEREISCDVVPCVGDEIVYDSDEPWFCVRLRVFDLATDSISLSDDDRKPHASMEDLLSDKAYFLSHGWQIREESP